MHDVDSPFCKIVKLVFMYRLPEGGKKARKQKGASNTGVEVEVRRRSERLKRTTLSCNEGGAVILENIAGPSNSNDNIGKAIRDLGKKNLCPMNKCNGNTDLPNTKMQIFLSINHNGLRLKQNTVED